MEFQTGDGVQIKGQVPSVSPPPEIELIVGDEGLVDGEWHKLSNMIYVPTLAKIDEEVNKLRIKHLKEQHDKIRSYQPRSKVAVSSHLCRKGMHHSNY